MKIFKLNDCDWWAGEDLEQTIATAMHDMNIPREDVIDDYMHELTDEELDRLRFVDDSYNYDEDDPKHSRSFREQLALMVERGDSFPCLFASTEF